MNKTMNKWSATEEIEHLADLKDRGATPRTSLPSTSDSLSEACKRGLSSWVVGGC